MQREKLLTAIPTLRNTKKRLVDDIVFPWAILAFSSSIFGISRFILLNPSWGLLTGWAHRTIETYKNAQLPILTGQADTHLELIDESYNALITVANSGLCLLSQLIPTLTADNHDDKLLKKSGLRITKYAKDICLAVSNEFTMDHKRSLLKLFKRSAKPMAGFVRTLESVRTDNYKKEAKTYHTALLDITRGLITIELNEKILRPNIYSYPNDLLDIFNKGRLNDMSPKQLAEHIRSSSKVLLSLPQETPMKSPKDSAIQFHSKISEATAWNQVSNTLTWILVITAATSIIALAAFYAYRAFYRPKKNNASSRNLHLYSDNIILKRHTNLQTSVRTWTRRSYYSTGVFMAGLAVQLAAFNYSKNTTVHAQSALAGSALTCLILLARKYYEHTQSQRINTLLIKQKESLEAAFAASTLTTNPVTINATSPNNNPDINNCTIKINIHKRDEKKISAIVQALEEANVTVLRCTDRDITITPTSVDMPACLKRARHIHMTRNQIQELEKKLHTLCAGYKTCIIQVAPKNEAIYFEIHITPKTHRGTTNQKHLADMGMQLQKDDNTGIILKAPLESNSSTVLTRFLQEHAETTASHSTPAAAASRRQHSRRKARPAGETEEKNNTAPDSATQEPVQPELITWSNGAQFSRNHIRAIKQAANINGIDGYCSREDINLGTLAFPITLPNGVTHFVRLPEKLANKLDGNVRDNLILAMAAGQVPNNFKQVRIYNKFTRTTHTAEVRLRGNIGKYRGFCKTHTDPETPQTLFEVTHVRQHL
jgi:hypothetical protein